MKKTKINLFEEIIRINELNGSNSISGKNLIVVDIQPEYQKHIYFLNDFVNFLNKNSEKFQSITFLYNGHDTLGLINENDYKMWWIVNNLEEEVIGNATFYDKGYAFFRYCIDSQIDDNSIENLVSLMNEKNINDSRDLDEEFWDYFIEKYGDKDIRELLEFSDDCITLPDLMDFLEKYNDIVLVGGRINECLKEVEISLRALGKSFITIPKYLY